MMMMIVRMKIMEKMILMTIIVVKTNHNHMMTMRMMTMKMMIVNLMNPKRKDAEERKKESEHKCPQEEKRSLK